MKDIVKKAAPSTLVIAIAAIVTNVIWGTPYKLLKIMNSEFSIAKDLADQLDYSYLGQVIAAVSIRFFIAGIITLIFAIILKQNIFKVTKRQWSEVAVMGLMSTTIAYFFFNIANVNIVSTINSTIVAQSTIFFAAILAHFAYKNDKLTPMKVFALVIGFIGLIVSQLTGGKNISELFNGVSIMGEGFMLMYGLVAALATMLAKRIGSSLNSFVMTGWNLIIGSIVLLFVGLALGGNLAAITWTPLGIGMLIILAFASAIPFSLWYWCAQYANLSEISMYKFLQPLSGSLLAVILGESFTMPLAIGLVFVCLAIILISKPNMFKKKQIETATVANEA